MTSADLDRWAAGSQTRMCGAYVASWRPRGRTPRRRPGSGCGAADGPIRSAGWALLGQMATRDETTPDAWFVERLAHIEKHIHCRANAEREAMNMALIAIGCRNAALRKAATAAAKRIGKVEVDHGDTACKTPDAAPSIEKTWAHSTSKGFASPAAHERSRESQRTRC